MSDGDPPGDGSGSDEEAYAASAGEDGACAVAVEHLSTLGEAAAGDVWHRCCGDVTANAAAATYCGREGAALPARGPAAEGGDWRRRRA